MFREVVKERGNGLNYRYKAIEMEAAIHDNEIYTEKINECL